MLSVSSSRSISLIILLAVALWGCGSSESGPDVDATPTPDPAHNALDDAGLDISEEENRIRVLFLGDSITAGYGIDQVDAFPSLVETRLIERGYKVQAVDAGVSGDTSTGGLNRLEWLLQARVDILVLELGGNDGLRGIDLTLTRSNLAEIIDRTRETWPGVDIVLVGMQVPPNLGQDYTREFAGIYPSLAAEKQVSLVPFIGESFEDVVHLVQNDGIHPTEEGHALIAQKVLETVEPMVQSRS